MAYDKVIVISVKIIEVDQENKQSSNTNEFTCGAVIGELKKT